MAYARWVCVIGSLAGTAAQAQTVDPSELEDLRKRIEAQSARTDNLSELDVAARAEIDRLRRQLVDAAARVQSSEQAVTEAEARLRGLKAAEGLSLARLQRREGDLADLLQALARLDRSPPPAIAVRPDDARAALRSAILLKTAIPELHAEGEALRAQIEELAALREEIVNARTGLVDATDLMAEQRRELAALIAQKEARQKELSAAAAAEQAELSKLASKAETLSQLIASLEARAARHLPLARPEPPAPSRVADVPAPKARPDEPPPHARGSGETQVASLGTQPTRPLPKLTGRNLPVAGHIVQRFGEETGAGQHSAGIAISTRPKAQIVSPISGEVEFAGPFRDYGQLLILATTGGYHILLAGMDAITAEVGEQLRLGEPVGSMGNDGSSAAPLVAVDLLPGQAQGSAQPSMSGQTDPLLYMEVRKHGVARDPEAWLRAGN